ncbi:hypothetical protein OXX79_012193, partial [Metschnikowia pulcherrima]
MQRAYKHTSICQSGAAVSV